MLATLLRDVQAARDRDPAARNTVEVLLCYSGVHAVVGHRLCHWLWHRDHKLVARVLSQAIRAITGVEIHPAARLGPGLFIDHALGVVIGETTEVGEDVTLYQGVTLGGTSLEKGKRHPTIGDRVTVGAGAKVLGPITVGDDARIGANAVVIKAVPANSVVVGVPGQVITGNTARPTRPAPRIDDGQLPDLVGSTLHSLLQRVDGLETTVLGHLSASEFHEVAVGVWCGDDFSI